MHAVYALEHTRIQGPSHPQFGEYTINAFEGTIQPKRKNPVIIFLTLLFPKKKEKTNPCHSFPYNKSEWGKAQWGKFLICVLYSKSYNSFVWCMDWKYYWIYYPLLSASSMSNIQHVKLQKETLKIKVKHVSVSFGLLIFYLKRNEE